MDRETREGWNQLLLAAQHEHALCHREKTLENKLRGSRTETLLAEARWKALTLRAAHATVVRREIFGSANCAGISAKEIGLVVGLSGSRANQIVREYCEY